MIATELSIAVLVSNFRVYSDVDGPETYFLFLFLGLAGTCVVSAVDTSSTFCGDSALNEKFPI